MPRRNSSAASRIRCTLIRTWPPPVSSNDIQIISRAIQDGVTLEEARTLLIHDRGTNNGTAFTAVAIGDTSAQRLYKRLKNDQTGYFDSRYILRHTTNVSNRWAVNVADLNVNRIYTTAQLLSEVQNALSWVFPLPPRLAYKITALASAFIADYGTQPDADHYQIGWLKSASPEQSAATTA